MRRGGGFYYRTIDKFAFGIITAISRGEASIGSFLEARNVRVSDGSIKKRKGQFYLTDYGEYDVYVDEVINGLYQYVRQYNAVGGAIATYSCYIFGAEDKLYLWDGYADDTEWDITDALAFTLTDDDIWCCTYLDYMYIANGHEIVKTDGTTSGTTLLTMDDDITAPSVPLALTYDTGALNGYRDYKYRYVHKVAGVDLITYKSEFYTAQPTALLVNKLVNIEYVTSGDVNTNGIEIWATETYTDPLSPNTQYFRLFSVPNANSSDDDNISDEVLRTYHTEEILENSISRFAGANKPIVYHDRMYWIREDFDPSLLWYSELGRPEEVDDDSWIDIKRDDGDVITICGVLGNSLLVFKNRSVWSITGDPDAVPIIQVEVGGDQTPNQTDLGVGCTSPRSLVSIGDALIFYSKVHGVYKISRNTGLQCISNQVADSIIGLDDVAGGIYRAEDGILYYVLAPQSGNAWVCNLSTNAWVNDTNVNPKCFLVDSNGYLLGGKAGYINRYYEPDCKYDNDDVEIDSYFRFHWIDLSDGHLIGLPRKLDVYAKDQSGFFTIQMYNENSEQPYDNFAIPSNEYETDLMGEPSRLCSFSFYFQSGEIERLVLRYLKQPLR